MSEHREQLVDVGSGQLDRARLGEVRSWLRRSGWAVEDAAANDWLEADAESDRFGPNALRTFPGVYGTVTATWHDDAADWSAGGATGAPTCQACGARPDEVWYFDEVEPRWTSSSEPEVRCTACGWTALVGDWDLSDSGARGNPGVVLDVSAGGHDGGQVAAALITELEQAVGGRWRWVHLHL